VISSSTAIEAEKQAALDMLRELAPALAAIDICRHVTWKNATIQQLIDEAAAKL